MGSCAFLGGIFEARFGVWTPRIKLLAEYVPFGFQKMLSWLETSSYNGSNITWTTAACFWPAQAKTLSWWSHAQLEEVKIFLRRERDQGRFQPVFNDGLDWWWSGSWMTHVEFGVDYTRDKEVIWVLKQSLTKLLIFCNINFPKIEHIVVLSHF